MGNLYGNKKKVEKIEQIEQAQLNKKRFEESFLDIYVLGKYDKLMDLLIGERRDTMNDIDKDKILLTITEKKQDFQKDDILTNNSQEDTKQKTNLIEDFNKIYEDRKEDLNKKKNLGFIGNISNFVENKNNINSFNNYCVKNTTFNWDLHFYCNKGFSIKNIEEIKENINDNIDNKTNNILLVFIDSISQIYEVINVFKTINKEFHPLFLFIMKDKVNEEINNSIMTKIKNYIHINNITMFNLRNITIKNFVDLEKNTNENIVKSYILDIYLYLINSWLYYNNFGDDYIFDEFIEKKQLNFLLKDLTSENQIKKENENKGSGLLNILIIGRPGVGKSTLMNILSESKRSMESKGINVTKYINRFVLKKFNITLYDTPGFEFDTDIEQIKCLIEELNIQLIKKRNQIHLIFYLLNAQNGRDFYDSEKEILKVLMNNEIHTFFLLTFCPNKHVGNEIKEIVEKNLKRLLLQLDKEKGLNYFNNKIQIFPVHLLDEIDYSCKNFGLKTVFEEAYNKFKNFIIDDTNIEKLQEYLAKDEEELKQGNKSLIYDILNKNNNIIYKYIGDIDNLLNNAIDESKKRLKTISFCYSSIRCFLFLGFIPSQSLEDYLKNILLSNFSEYFKRKTNEKEQNDSLKESVEQVEKGKFISKLPFLSNYYEMNNWGKHFINKYSKELNDEGINGLSKYLIDLIKSYNKSIINLKELGNLFNE